MNRFRLVWCALISPLLLPGLMGLALAQRPPRLNVAYATNSTAQSPLWVSKEAGFFTKNGLEVTALYVQGGVRAVQAMLGGDVPITLTGGPEVLHAIVAGGEVTIVAGFLNTMPYYVVAEKGITRPELLKGKKMAVSGFGASSHFATVFALRQWGLEPNRDVAILPIGNTPARLAALMSGSINATILSAGEIYRARKAGFIVLTDLISLGLAYHATGVNVNNAYLGRQREVVRRFLKAMVEGVHYFKTNKEGSIKIIARYLRSDDREFLEESYTAYAEKLTPQKPYPNLEGIQRILDELATKDPRAKGIKPEQVVDVSLLQELDRSGFIDALYR